MAKTRLYTSGIGLYISSKNMFQKGSRRLADLDQRWTFQHWSMEKVAALIPWAIAPCQGIAGSTEEWCLHAEAIHNRIEISIPHVKEVINIFKYLDVCIQIYHLVVLLKLPTNQKSRFIITMCKDINIVKIYAELQQGKERSENASPIWNLE